MKCPKCGYRFKLLAGDSNPPGVFFFIALGAWVVTGVIWSLGLSPWHYVAGFIAIFPTVAVLPALWDQTTYGEVKCGNCGARQRIMPWSL